MFRGKTAGPRKDIDQFLPEMRRYVKERYVARPAPQIKYSIPVSLPGQPRFGSGADGPKESDRDRMPVAPAEARKDLSLLDSPAMKRYYHSWEKEKAVARSFSSEVMRLVGEKYPKASAFYLPAGIDKRTFHKIRSDYLYKPSRSTAMKCCLGLKLDLRESEYLLQLAGYAFSPSDPSDLIIMFCIEKGIWDLASVNYLMASLDVRDLDGYAPD